MDPQALPRNGKSKVARAAAVEGISPSLMPLLFSHLGKDGHPLSSAFDVTALPRTAAMVCKLAGLMMQAYWYLLRSRPAPEPIPPEFDDLLLQVWGGHQRYDELMAVSVLQYAGIERESSPLGRLVKNPGVLYKWGELLRSRRGRLKAHVNELSKADWHEQFSILIDALPILRVASFDGEHFIFPEGKVPKFPYVFDSPKCRDTLYLYSFEHPQTKPVIIFEDPRSDYTEELPLEAAPGYAQQYRVIREVLGFEDVRQGIIHLFGGSYQHIQNIAYAIAKTPGEALDGFISRHRADFSGVSPDSSKEDFITLTLAEMGPTKVLKTLLDFNGELLLQYLQRLAELGVCDAAEWKAAFEARRAEKLESVRGFLELIPTNKGRMERQIDLETRCWCVIRAAGLDLDSPRDYVESIGMRISMLETLRDQYRNNRDDIWSVGVRVAKLIERTFKFLICFYSGLNRYYISTQNNEDDFARHEEMMLAGARDAYGEVYRDSPGALISKFRSLATKMNKEAMFALLGRSRVCDLDKFKDLTQGKWTDIAEVINSVKHDKPERKLAREEFTTFLSQSLELFRFFRDGKEIDDGLSCQEMLCESSPVYPSVVSFREQHRKRDGLVICNYKVYSHDWKDPDDAKDMGIKILSPHEYAPNEEYYCIPFHKRTTKEWLLDPFLINCNKFNKIFQTKDRV